MNSIFPTRPGTAKAARLLAPLLAVLAFCPPARALTISPTFDSSITGDPQAATIEATINSAIAVYEANFSDPITVNITFQEQSAGLGNSSTRIGTVSYPVYRAALLSHATSVDDATAWTYLPNTANNPVNNDPSVYLSLPLGRALGLTSMVGSPDGTIFLNTSICNLSAAQTNATYYSLFAVVSHEIDEVLGSSSALTGLTNGAATLPGPIYVEDLFRYDQNGARSFTTAVNAAAYFSLDGSTALARFNQTQGGDFSDWYSCPCSPCSCLSPLPSAPPQVQDAWSTPGSTPVLGVELRMLDVLGYTRPPSPEWVDFHFTGTPAGTFAAPDKTLSAGVTRVNTGGTIEIKAGNSGEALTITKQMLLTSFGGTANIGLAHPVAAPPLPGSAKDAPQPDPEPAGSAFGEIGTATGGMSAALPGN